MTDNKSASNTEPTNGMSESAPSGPTSSEWPTDPKSLGIDAAAMAIDAHGNWRPAYRKLLTSLKLAYVDLVNRTLGSVARELGQPLNGWDFRRTRGPQQVTQDAEDELKGLQRRGLQHRKALKTLPLPSETEAPTADDWLKLGAILAFCVAIEAGANGQFLPGEGFIETYLTAVLLSVVNVCGLGAGGGFALSALRRHQKSRGLFQLGCGLLIIFAVVLNWAVGGYREKELAGQEEQSVFSNPVDWELNSFLLLLLGLVACTVGFYKGYTFIKAGVKRKEVEESQAREWKDIKERYSNLSERYRRKLTQGLRAEVAGWIEQLDRKRRRARNVLEDVKEGWEHGTYLDFVESDFIVAHNKHNADKIDREMVDLHRESVDVDWSFPATPADWRILDDADEIVTAWRDSGQEAFFDSIHLECEKITDLWKRYESVILAPATGKEMHNTG